MSDKKIGHKIIIGILLVYLILPLFATFLFAFASNWQTTILPEGYTLNWFKILMSDPLFWQCMGRSVLVSFLSVAVIMVLTIPSVYFVVIYYPKLEKILQICAMIPFALPAVIMSVGLIQIYSSGPVMITGTMWILLGAYVILCLPFMYQATRNSLRTIDAVGLVEAAQSLGSSKFASFLKVVFPNIMPGVIVAGLLCFSIVFGEFVYVNLLVGTNYETIQYYLYKSMYTNGHLSSAIVCIYFMIILILSFLMVNITKKANKRTTKIED